MSWYLLPEEIRCAILETLVSHELSIAHYAPVCREWQQFIEQITFREVQLTTSRLRGLSKIAYSRSSFIKYIVFNIGLQKYDCTQCDDIFTETWQDIDIGIVETALQNLFCALSAWSSTEAHLTLDISISSPSDTEILFSDIPWTGGQPISFPSLPAMNRMFDFVEFSEEFWCRLPQVTAITGLQIRRQYRRQFEPRTLQRLLTHLPMVQTICYEPSREYTRLDQEEVDESNRFLMTSLSSSHLKRLMIFEDFETNLWKIPLAARIHIIESKSYPIRKANCAVSRALAKTSLGLEILSASFIIDAVDFFSARQPSWVWHDLTSLALTSRALVSRESTSMGINDLLQEAAMFVRSSPKLTTLTLWNCDANNACAFIYETSQADRRAKITWRATWIMALTPATIKSWEVVSRERGLLELLVMKEELDAGAFWHCRGYAIKHLRLPTQVILSQSLSEILEEIPC